MIVSHRHRFIFLKTRKTAGTSIELALRHVLGPDDIATPVEEDGELDVPPPRNCVTGAPEWTPRNLWRALRGKSVKRTRIRGHATAVTVRQIVGEDVWQNYFKFCFERNPWDRQVSQYHFKLSRSRFNVDFKTSLGRKTSYVRNWDIYTINSEIVVDEVFRYEKLKADFAEVCRRIGLSEVPELPHAKGGLRPKGHYHSYYDEEAKELVARMYRAEIERFGYVF